MNRDVIDEILARTDIENLIGSYVSLKRAGSNLKGLCPFHSEKTPSFTVFPDSNSFYCFGCGIGGDAVTFVKQAEHLDYPDAVAFLARRAGISEELLNSGDKPETPRYDKRRLCAMNVDAAKFFHARLTDGSAESKPALDYLMQKRGLSMSVIKHFGLGYSPDSYYALYDYMRKRGYSDDELSAGYLCGKSERGNQHYDLFRNRVMFPIIDMSGNVIAFGGRVMDDSVPKYKNSSDTPVFKKSRNLFALNFARHTCEESIILCEGYMDVIALHASGFTNAVATLGTAITQEQARIISKYTKKVLISYDMDEAGRKAAERAMRFLEEVGLEVKVLEMKGAKDPDEYIKKFGADKFRSVINGSKSKFDYNMDKVLSKYDISVPQDRINAIGEISNLISGVYSAAERDIYIRSAAEMLSVDYKSLKHDVDRITEKRKAQFKAKERQKVFSDTAGISDRVNPDFSRMPAAARCEEVVLGLLIAYPEHRKRVFNGDEDLSENDFPTELGRRIFRFLERSWSEGDDALTRISEEFTPEETGRITRMKLDRLSLSDNSDNVLHESISSLKNAVMKAHAKEGVGSIDELDRILENIRRNQGG